MPKSGMTIPILGVRRRSTRRPCRSLADALLTRTQQRVLGRLFGHPDRSFYAAELIRDARTGSGAAQRELAKLEESGLVVARRIGPCVSVLLSVRRPVRFPSVLLQPLGHLSVFRFNNLRAVWQRLSHTPPISAVLPPSRLI
jgi:hypothetical protein